MNVTGCEVNTYNRKSLIKLSSTELQVREERGYLGQYMRFWSMPTGRLRPTCTSAQSCQSLHCLYTQRMAGVITVLIDFSLTVKAATLIFISGRGSAISSAKEGKSGSIYNLVKSS